MKIAQLILACFALLTIVSSSTLAQEGLTGTISKVDEAMGKITIQQTQTGTGSATAGASEDFKIQDGLIFNAFKPGDKVIFSASEMNGVKTITKLQKQ